MPDINSLASRIDAEFAAVEREAKKFQSEQAEQHKQREKRLEQLNKVFDELRDIWRPRVELLIKKFGDRVQATPRSVPSTREATFEFQSRVARVRLKLSALTDRDIQKVILSYDLDIIPVLMRFKNHDEIEFPLEALDKEAATKWLDDRIVEFIQTYFSGRERNLPKGLDDRRSSCPCPLPQGRRRHNTRAGRLEVLLPWRRDPSRVRKKAGQRCGVNRPQFSTEPGRC